MKKKFKKKLILTIIIVIVLIVIVIVKFTLNDSKRIIGLWTTDGVTVYEFNKDNTGTLILPLSKYKFTYKIEKKKLYIDFENEKSEDSEYEYSFSKKKLILNGDNGTYIFSRKED